MRVLARKLKPANGVSHFFHLLLQVVLPVLLYILVQNNFIPVAFLIVILSKWRMFAVRPRFWPANIRANAVDIMVGISTVLFMTHTTSTLARLGIAVLYAGWLVFIKPATGIFMTSMQAFIGQFVALLALYASWTAGPVFGLTALTGLICYLAARHFFESFDEPYTKLLSYIWGYFGAALAWLLSRLLVSYLVGGSGSAFNVSQPVLFLSIMGYGIAVLYYLEHFDRLSRLVKRQTMFVVIVVALALLVSLYLETNHLIA